MNLEYRSSSIHGKGVFTTELICQGEIMYGGIKGYGYNKGGLNHSYNPNMGYIKGGIVALRAIQPNEELTLNYVDGFINLGYSRKEAERIVLIEIAVKKLE